MTRRFREGEHPRQPAGSGRGGEFREKGTGWAGRLSDRIGLPSVRSFLEGPPSTDYPQVAAQLEGRYGTGGMIVIDASVYRMGGDYLDSFRPVHGGHVEMSGAITSEDSPDEGGYFRITASHGPDEIGGPNIWRASIDRMHVRGSAQGGGGGRELTDRFIDWFRQSGFDEVTVGPSEIGSYAWGAMGFDFADFESRRIAFEGAVAMSVEQVRGHFRYSDYGDDGSSLTDAQIKKMIGQYRRAAALAAAGAMSYQKLSQYGRKPGQGKDDWWAGKLGLIVGGVGTGMIKF
jgi:GNAT superfamily N-acetyltransferase